ncbi:MAG TPA: VWA domain-containing protein [Candidatus Angelobacter sp.]|nr:VWA domain-containing protein [Candidatus Angelobacter sp.]
MMWKRWVLSLLFSLVIPGSFSVPQQSTQDPAKTGADNPQNVFRSEVNLVSVYFTVRDHKKQLSSDLDQNRFRVYEDGKEQPIKFFAHHSDVVLNVGMLLDTGTNMAWILGEEAQASSAFLQHVVRPTDLGFVLNYASRVETLQVPTSDIALLQEKVNSIRSWGKIMGPPDQAPPPPPQQRSPLPGMGGGWPGGGPVPQPGPTGQPYNLNREAHLYDAIRVGTLRYLEHEVGRKAVVIIALSGDAKSESSLEDALEVLLQNDVIAYVLQIYDPPRERSRFDRCDVIHTYEKDDHGEYVLKKLAEATGGRMLEVHGIDKLTEALDEISNELHHQYSLGYYPLNPTWDGKFRKIQITTQGDGYKVFARKGYYALPRNR